MKIRIFSEFVAIKPISEHDKACFTTRKSPFHTSIKPISEHEMGHFATPKKPCDIAFSSKPLTDSHLAKAAIFRVFAGKDASARLQTNYDGFTTPIFNTSDHPSLNTSHIHHEVIKYHIITF